MIKNLESDPEQHLNVQLVLHNRLLAEGLRLLLATGSSACEVLPDACDKAFCQPAADMIIIDPFSLANFNLPSGQNTKLMLLDTGLSREQLITLLITYKIDGIISRAKFKKICVKVYKTV